MATIGKKKPCPNSICLPQGGTGQVCNGATLRINSLQDSRCPVNVQCIWAGQANVTLLLSKGRASITTELILGAQPQDQAEVTLDNKVYDVLLQSVEPYPVSFGGLAWITYTDYNVQFGLWRVCHGAQSASRTCSTWSSSRNTVDSTTNAIIFAGQPGFIGAAQGLEITSIILYLIAGILIILGIIDLQKIPIEYMFIGAAALLFLTIIFLSAALGVMSVQGRNHHSGAYLDWAWWIGLLGLIMTIICVILLIIFILDVYQKHPPKLQDNNNSNFNNSYPGQQQWNNFSPMTIGQFVTPPPPTYFSYPSYNQWPAGQQVPQFYPNNQVQNPFVGYGGMTDSRLSPFLAAMARQQLNNMPPGQFY
ncbi:unnamed protein product [Adineta steineri]|uniref:Uncharacterized protein n=1 Tax=Adineta steineri TaxID=433720 RepID=A0A819FEB4_9BILA|nr:unnamed protein product [Adineta steineri]